MAGGARFSTGIEDETESETKVFVQEAGVDGVNEVRFHVGVVIRGGR